MNKHKLDYLRGSSNSATVATVAACGLIYIFARPLWRFALGVCCIQAGLNRIVNSARRGR